MSEKDEPEGGYLWAWILVAVGLACLTAAVSALSYWTARFGR